MEFTGRFSTHAAPPEKQKSSRDRLARRGIAAKSINLSLDSPPAEALPTGEQDVNRRLSRASDCPGGRLGTSYFVAGVRLSWMP
jgi:hypothetical protein